MFKLTDLISDVQLELNVPRTESLRSDFAGTSLISGTLGDSVKNVEDISGHFRDAAHATGVTYNPIGLNGRPSLFFNGTQILKTPSFLTGLLNNQFTLYMAYHATAGDVLFSDDPGTERLQRLPGSNAMFMGTFGVFGNCISRPTLLSFGYRASSNTTRTLQSSINTRSSEIFDSNRRYTFATGAQPWVGALTIGDYTPSPGINVTMNLGFLGIVSRFTEEVEDQEVLSNLAETFNIASLPHIEPVGDSITSGEGHLSNARTECWPYLLGQDLAGIAAVTGDAYAGRRIDLFLKESFTFTEARTWPQASNYRETAVLFLGGNDAVTAGVPTAIDRWKRAVSRLRSQGKNVIACTFPPRSDLLEADRQTFNTFVRTSYMTYGCIDIVELGLDPIIGLPGSESNPTYFDIDGIHPIAAGHVRIKDVVKPVVLRSGLQSYPPSSGFAGAFQALGYTPTRASNLDLVPNRVF